jgi:secondary thiamine-phosphate synthase enzyme
LYTLDLKTRQRTEFIDVTSRVRECVERSGLKNGAVVVYVPHTTAGCTINENADPDVVRDILTFVNRSIPFEGDYRHSEGNSAAHIKASFFGISQHVLVEDARLVLGTWQGIYFCEFDGPRSRKMHVQLLRGVDD